jgi:hypothetical protein
MSKNGRFWAKNERGASDCFLDCELQNYFFLGGRFHPQTIPRKPSVDTAKADRYVGCHSRELVIVVTWRHYRAGRESFRFAYRFP